MEDFIKKLLDFVTSYFSSNKITIESIPKLAVKKETPWMDWLGPMLGGSEDDPKFVAKVEKYWGLVGLPGWKGLSGSGRAWCAMIGNAALINTGYLGTNDASAVSFLGCGTKCIPEYGAGIVVKHQDGEHHFTFFVRWIDDVRKIAICRGGNQSNALIEKVFNFSGNSKGFDEIQYSFWPVKRK